MKFIILPSILLAAASLTAQVDERSSFQLDPRVLNKRVSTLGHLELYENLGELKCNNVRLFPVVACYTSDMTKSNSSILPPGWTFPLFDSHVVQVSETVAEVLLPTGRLVRLIKRAPDGDWGGSGYTGVESNNRFELRDKWTTVTFHEGRIKQLRMGNQNLVWETDSNLERRIVYKGQTLATLASSASGTVTSLMIQGEAGKQYVRFEHDPPPPLGIPVTVELYRTLAVMRTIKSDLVGRELFYEFSRPTPEYNRLDQSVRERGQEVLKRSFVTTKTGLVEQMDDNFVSVIYPDERFTVPMIVVRKKSGDELLQPGFGSKDGLELKATFEGITEQVYMRFPNNLKNRVLRKETLRRPDGTVVELYRARHDSEGTLIQDEAGEYERNRIDGTMEVLKNGIPWNSY